MNYPRISIITPSYNQGQFLEETILSIIGQNYPNLEYIILDGGSTDNSVEIIKKYEKNLTFWECKKDNGQADAINKGFSMATGDILGWLNSDDMYLPNTLLHISAKLDINLPQLVFGNSICIKEGKPNMVWSADLSNRLKKKDFMNGSLIQPSTFWTRKAWDMVGDLNDKMHFIFDLEWFNRAKSAGVKFIYTRKHLSIYRFHSFRKIFNKEKERLYEIASVYGQFRNENYETAFRHLADRQSKVRRVNSFINKIKFFRSDRIQLYLFKLFFPVLKKIKNEDLNFFLNRIVKIPK